MIGYRILTVLKDICYSSQAQIECAKGLDRWKIGGKKQLFLCNFTTQGVVGLLIESSLHYKISYKSSDLIQSKFDVNYVHGWKSF